MKRFFGSVPMLLVLFAAPGAQADPTLECSNRAGSQIEVGECLVGVEKNVDAAMVDALGFALEAARELDKVTERKSVVPALEAGQANWSAYRDQHCEYVGTTWGGGSGTGMAIRSCRIELGRARTDVLMQFAN